MQIQEELKLEEINKAVNILKKGGIVIFPTDTVYAIGCLWNNMLAKARLRRIKVSHQNFPILIDNLSQLHQLAKVNGPAQQLINKFWPGALTIVLKSKHGSGKVGIRMPKSKIARALVAGTGAPLIGTSASFADEESPKKYEDLDDNLKKLVDFTVEGMCELKKESTVVDATTIPFKILRYGALTIT